MIKREWLFKDLFENEIRKIYNPKSLKQIATEKIKIDGEQLNKELAKRCTILFFPWWKFESGIQN